MVFEDIILKNKSTALEVAKGHLYNKKTKFKFFSRFTNKSNKVLKSPLAIKLSNIHKKPELKPLQYYSILYQEEGRQSQPLAWLHDQRLDPCIEQNTHPTLRGSCTPYDQTEQN